MFNNLKLNSQKAEENFSKTSVFLSVILCPLSVPRLLASSNAQTFRHRNVLRLSPLTAVRAGLKDMNIGQ
jgi:hypothetical protein